MLSKSIKFNERQLLILMGFIFTGVVVLLLGGFVFITFQDLIVGFVVGNWLALSVSWTFFILVMTTLLVYSTRGKNELIEVKHKTKGTIAKTVWRPGILGSIWKWLEGPYIGRTEPWRIMDLALLPILVVRRLVFLWTGDPSPFMMWGNVSLTYFPLPPYPIFWWWLSFILAFTGAIICLGKAVRPNLDINPRDGAKWVSMYVTVRLMTYILLLLN